MQNLSGGQVEGLSLTLKILEPVIVGLSVIGVITVANRGKTPLTISSRLNLSEGDLELIITGSDGNKHKVTAAGIPPDTPLNIVVLAPGKEIVSAINLLYTNIGNTFSIAGNYFVEAVFQPAQNVGALCSELVKVTARLPKTASEAQAIEILKNEMVKTAIIKAEKDYAPAELLALASNYPDTLDGKLASLLVSNNQQTTDGASSAENIFTQNAPLNVALWITALTTPFSRTGGQLKTSFLHFLERAEVTAANDQNLISEDKLKALKIVKGLPI